MKTIVKYGLLSILGCFLSIITAAQAHSFTALEAGFHSGVGHFDGLNTVIDRYNETRQGGEGQATLSKNMEHFSGLSGYDFALSRIFDDAGIYFDIRVTKLRATSRAEGMNLDGTTGWRELELVQGTFDMGLGWTFIQNSNMEVQIGFGMPIGKHRVLMSSFQDETKSEAVDEFMFGLEPHFQLYLFLSRKIPLAAFGRAYYMWSALPVDYTELNQTINPVSSALDDDLDLTSRPNMLGLTLGVCLVFHERDHSFTRGNR